jgi:hypothetical protein
MRVCIRVIAALTFSAIAQGTPARKFLIAILLIWEYHIYQDAAFSAMQGVFQIRQEPSDGLALIIMGLDFQAPPVSQFDDSANSEVARV